MVGFGDGQADTGPAGGTAGGVGAVEEWEQALGVGGVEPVSGVGNGQDGQLLAESADVVSADGDSTAGWGVTQPRPIPPYQPITTTSPTRWCAVTPSPS
jgi:hypothetical protein